VTQTNIQKFPRLERPAFPRQIFIKPGQYRLSVLPKSIFHALPHSSLALAILRYGLHLSISFNGAPTMGRPEVGELKN